MRTNNLIVIYPMMIPMKQLTRIRVEPEECV